MPTMVLAVAAVALAAGVELARQEITQAMAGTQLSRGHQWETRWVVEVVRGQGIAHRILQGMQNTEGEAEALKASQAVVRFLAVAVALGVTLLEERQFKAVNGEPTL